MNKIPVPLRSAVAFSILLASCSRGPHSSAVSATYNPETGELSQLTVNGANEDKPSIFSYMDGSKFVRIEIDGDKDGKIDRWEYYSADQKLEKVGLSRSNDGIVDAWLFQGADGTVNRIEVSTYRDGRVNRLEFYESGERVRAEEDTNKDGRADRWETYRNGHLATVSFDTTGSGTPNHVIDYRSNP